MPNINKLESSHNIKTLDKKEEWVDKSDNLNHKVYNSSKWRKLRLVYLGQNPECEVCKDNGRITLAVEVHHIIPISSGRNLKEKYIIGYDYNNLMSICKECHKKIHND